jgi:hypothetical protein
MWELESARQRGAALACKVAERYKTYDVVEIAKRANVKVVRARWRLVTVARVEGSMSNDDLERAIIAHELGHFFDWVTRIPHAKRNSYYREHVAHSFAAHLLKLPFAPTAYERIWRSV